MRPVLLDEAGLQQEGFLLRVRIEELDARRLGYHGAGLGGELVGRAEIGEHAFAQVAGLAHIDDAPGGILIKIDAGRGRYGRGGRAFHAWLRGFLRSVAREGLFLPETKKARPARGRPGCWKRAAPSFRLLQRPMR